MQRYNENIITFVAGNHIVEKNKIISYDKS